MTLRRFFNVWVDAENKEFEKMCATYDVVLPNIQFTGNKVQGVDDKDSLDICIAGKFGKNTKEVMIIDDCGNFWSTHPDVFNAYGTKLLAFIASMTSPAFAEDLIIDRKFIIVNGYEKTPTSEAYVDSLKKLFGMWAFRAFIVQEDEPNNFEIMEQTFTEIQLAPPVDGMVH